MRRATGVARRSLARPRKTCGRWRSRRQRFALAVALGWRRINSFKIAETPFGAYHSPGLEGLENDSASEQLPAALVNNLKRNERELPNR